MFFIVPELLKRLDPGYILKLRPLIPLLGILIGFCGAALRGIILPPETRCNVLFTYLLLVKSAGLPMFCGFTVFTVFLNTLGI